MPLCLCGCGNETKKGTPYLRGHNRRFGPFAWFWLTLENSLRTCACGCGKPVLLNRDFVHGHVLSDFINKHPEHQSLAASEAGKITGAKNIVKANKKFDEHPELRIPIARLGGAASGSANLKKITHEQHVAGGTIGGTRTHELYPNLSSENGKRLLELHPSQFSDMGKNTAILHPELASIRGKKSGDIAVKTGQIFKAPKGKFVWHEASDSLTVRHWHRSNPELEYCTELQPKYPKDYIHTNVQFKGIEIDFVISPPESFNPSDPHTWLEIHEYHQVRFWEGEIYQDYLWTRAKDLRLRGARLPTTLLCHGKLGLHQAQLAGVVH